MEVTLCGMKSMWLVSSSHLRHEKSSSAGSFYSDTWMEFHTASWRSHFCFIAHLLETKYIVYTLYCATEATHIKQHPILSHRFSWISVLSCQTSKHTQMLSFTLITQLQPPATPLCCQCWHCGAARKITHSLGGIQKTKDPTFYPYGLTGVVLLR